jgi:hypothetical protein
VCEAGGGRGARVQAAAGKHDTEHLLVRWVVVERHSRSAARGVRSAVTQLGNKFGHIDLMKGKKVLIEHTSSNPNGPLHIGNLRNVMIGAHLANCMKAVGYEVSEAFYVNDLGAQIGLTALAYTRYAQGRPWVGLTHTWVGLTGGFGSLRKRFSRRPRQSNST